MLSTGSELPKPPLPIRQDGKFYSRLHPIKDSSSLACPSFRVYYGVASGAVPFLWESQPGIPKNTYSSNTLLQPPLSPPPSYFSSTKNKSSKKITSNKFDFKLSFRRKKFCHSFPFPSPSFASPISSTSLASTAGPAGASRCRSRRPVVKCFTCFWNHVDVD
ncbi:uncharacterized protein LOC122044280 [Zingiber officinale]|uniref:Uncharacterized protein n=1 Tax=Zingiber officinale TaxID=94328 RepID=A0A8J5HR15_ZINOF|nr:uncharacterized protein LOC122044280 [Zingiber officinale]KAG6530441.1 hypothetical protein ZIOFF_012680 [Zingiber officinale]